VLVGWVIDWLVLYCRLYLCDDSRSPVAAIHDVQPVVLAVE